MGLGAPASSARRGRGQGSWSGDPSFLPPRPLDQAGVWCVSCPARRADAPVRRSPGAPCLPARELQAGLLLRSLRACVPPDLLVTVLSAVPAQARSVFTIRSKIHRLPPPPDTGSPALWLRCVPLPDALCCPGSGSPPLTHCACAGGLARRPLRPAPSPGSVLRPPSRQATLTASCLALRPGHLLPSVCECPGVTRPRARAGGGH